MARLCDFGGRKVLDAGCGRADFLDYLLERGIKPAHYVGIEAMPELVEAGRQKNRPRSVIVQADFVREPSRLLVEADVVVLCGSMNTFDAAGFFGTIRTAYDAATEVVVFNFLSSPRLAAAEWLSWHDPADVLAFVERFSDDVRRLADYMDGDCTVAIRKAEGAGDNHGQMLADEGPRR
ncbi:MAG: class I SAM-dependent methyltransferase [Planctomycetota bacterium]|nr:class I SAM-dependent methyltransferase [Planctomycetota bacterium]